MTFQLSLIVTFDKIPAMRQGIRYADLWVARWNAVDGRAASGCTISGGAVEGTAVDPVAGNSPAAIGTYMTPAEIPYALDKMVVVLLWYMAHDVAGPAPFLNVIDQTITQVG